MNESIDIIIKLRFEIIRDIPSDSDKSAANVAEGALFCFKVNGYPRKYRE